MTAFSPLMKLLEQAASEGQPLEFWWRDDDAVNAGPKLEQLLNLARRYRAPVLLAVIPDQADDSILSHDPRGWVTIAQHGVDHIPRQKAGKNSEFPEERDPDEAAAAIAGGRDKLAALFGDRFGPIFVPPWNRMSEIHIDRLSEMGFTGYSGFGPRMKIKANGLSLFNTHIDLIDWRKDKKFLGAETLIGQMVKHLSDNKDEPTGILTHHLVHDPATWNFLTDLLETLSAHPGAQWITPWRQS